MSTEIYSYKPQGKIPNNRFPLLVHRNAIPGGGAEAEEEGPASSEAEGPR